MSRHLLSRSLTRVIRSRRFVSTTPDITSSPVGETPERHSATSPPAGETPERHSVSSQPSDAEERVPFGHLDVTRSEKRAAVGAVFDSAAAQYDLMNDLMSGGLHRLWKTRLVNRVAFRPGVSLLDVAGGTADVALAALSSLPHGKVADITVADINDNMLEIGRQKAAAAGVSERLSFVVADAERLPFEDESFDVYTIAFGLRNVADTLRALREARRVLKRGGQLLCLEFSHPSPAPLADLYAVYSREVIPVMGQLVAQDWASYQYLVESIQRWHSQEDLADLFREAGFCAVDFENWSCGIVALHSGVKL